MTSKQTVWLKISDKCNVLATSTIHTGYWTHIDVITHLQPAVYTSKAPLGKAKNDVSVFDHVMMTLTACCGDFNPKQRPKTLKNKHYISSQIHDILIMMTLDTDLMYHIDFKVTQIILDISRNYKMDAEKHADDLLIKRKVRKFKLTGDVLLNSHADCNVAQVTPDVLI
eukprot:1089554_1